MPYDMIMKLPIQDRRAFIHKHNMEEERINNISNENNNSNVRNYAGESINTFARMEQSNLRRGG